jgi:hypothetical protein
MSLSISITFIITAAVATAFYPGSSLVARHPLNVELRASFLDNIFGLLNNTKPSQGNVMVPEVFEGQSQVTEDDISLDAFQAEINKRVGIKKFEDGKDFDGYDLRDVIFEKWGGCYDLEFQPVDSFGFREIYLNVLPFKLGARGRWRHETELDYLMHLQAVVEILGKYNQLEYVLAQIKETNKKPRAGTSPLVAVPLRLDLTPEQVNKILPR